MSAHVPAGYHAVTPYLVVEEPATLIEFLGRTFDAKELHVVRDGEGRVMHAEVRIGDSPVMMGRIMPGSPKRSATLYVYVPDADATYRRALEAGATSVREPADQFYGDRSGGVADGQGNEW